MSDQSIKYPPPPAGMVEFKIIDGLIGYAVSYDYVRAYVWSCRGRWNSQRQQGVCLMKSWVEIGTCRSRDGYFVATIYEGGAASVKMVHRLVATAIHGPCPDLMECCHGVAGKECNLPCNISWGTRIQNMADRLRDGVHARGERSYAAKISEAQAMEVIHLSSNGFTNQYLADRFKVSQPHISRIVTGKRWPHLPRN